MTARDSGLIKQSMTIAGRRTSLALEPEFWRELRRIAMAMRKSVPALLGEVDARRAQETPDASLASSVRVYVLKNRTRQAAAAD